MSESIPLRALSVRFPWLELILRGDKTLEVRDRELKQRGLIALHAPWGIDYAAAHFFGITQPWKLRRGVIVGLANVTGVRNLEESDWPATVRQHRQPVPLSGGFYGIALTQVFRLPRPIACRGRPLIFPLEFEISRQVLAQCPPSLVDQLQAKPDQTEPTAPLSPPKEPGLQASL